MRHTFAGLAAAALMLSASVVYANPGEDSDLPEWLAERINPVHYGLSQFVDSTSRSIDSFFGTDESQFVNNTSFLRLSNELRLREGDSVNDTGIRFKLDLPTTQRRLRFVIQSDANEPLSATQNSQLSNGNRFREIGQFNSNNALLGFEALGNKKPSEGWANKLGVGVRARSQIDPYLRLTTTRQWNFENSKWQSNFIGRATYFLEEGYLTRAFVDLGRPVAPDKYFRVLSQAEWSQERDDTVFVNSVELNHILNNRSALRYAALLVGDTARSRDIYDRVLQLYFRRDIHKRILYADIVPEYHFPTEDGTKPFASLTLRLEMFFRGDFVPAMR